MRVSYVTPFYNGECDGRYGRFHDWLHTLRDMEDRPFEFDVHAFMATNPDETLKSVPTKHLGDAGDLWATKRNNLQTLLEAPQIYRDLQRSNPDVVHLVAFDSLLLPSLSAVSNDTPLVLGPNVGGWYPIREDDIWLTGPVEAGKLRAKYLLRKHTVSRLNYAQVLSFSRYHQRMLELLGVRRSDVTNLRPGVDPMFSPGETTESDGPPHEILYVGDFSEHKGYPLFLRAVSHLSRDVRVQVVGGGDPDHELIRTLGIEDLVTVDGFVDRSDLQRYYRSADLFVIPSIDETGPNTQFEALACGTPIVATDTDGINEFVPEDAAIHFWPRDPDSLATALESALENIPMLTSTARRHAHEFQASTTVEQLDSLYRSLV